MKVVPEDVSTDPLEGLVSSSQSTAKIYKCYMIYLFLLYNEPTFTSRFRTPNSSWSTSSALTTNNVVSSVTGVGNSYHEGSSRGCVHCSIGGVSERATVNSCMEFINNQSMY